MSGTTNEQRHRVLRLLDAVGPLTREEIGRSLGWSRAATASSSTLAKAARFGLIYLDHSTSRYEITEPGMRRIGKSKNPQNSNAAPGPDGPGGTVVDLAEKALRLVYEMAPDPATGHRDVALHITHRDAPDLWEAIQRCLLDGYQVPSLLEVPRRKRLQVLEESVDAWRASVHDRGCTFCGRITPSQVGWSSRGYLDNAGPSFVARSDGAVACRFCDEFTRENGGAAAGAAALRSAVFRAVVGCVSTIPIPDSAAVLIPFASEVPGGARNLTPWHHIANDAERIAGIRQAGAVLVHPKRLTRTSAAIAAASLPGLAAPRHPPLPARSESYVPPVVIRPDAPTVDDEIRALRVRHQAVRDRFLRDHPAGFVPGAEPWSEATGAAWSALLATQHQEMGRLQKKAQRRWSQTPGHAPSTIAR